MTPDLLNLLLISPLDFACPDYYVPSSGANIINGLQGLDEVTGRITITFFADEAGWNLQDQRN